MKALKNNIRNEIIEAMLDRGINANRLAIAVEGKISRSQVFDYFKGRTDLTSEKVNHLFDALGLKVVQVPTP